MAVTIKSSAKKKPVAPSGLTLPREYEEATGEFSDFSLLVHGEKKAGKTTLSLQTEDKGNVLLIEFDPKQKAYRRMERCPKSWKEFVGYLDLLEKDVKEGKWFYERVVIDGVDSWFRLCQKWVCEKLVIDHPSEEKWGKGWDLLRVSFTDAVMRLLALPCGVWFICHSKWTEVETHDENKKIMKLLPILPGQAEEILNGKVEGWLAYDYIGDKRTLIIQGSERIGAGHRMDEEKSNPHMRTTGGVKVSSIYMGESAEEGYRNLLAAYRNEQTYARVSDMGAEKKGGVRVVVRKK